MNDDLIRVGRLNLPIELPTFDSDFLQWKREFWTKKLKAENIKYVVAPMVDQSELAFRMMMKKHNAHLSYTPMIHAQLFVTNLTYRRTAFESCKADRPLIVQFCANDAKTFLDACRLVEDVCDGVDLNLGCPQIVAKKGQYGSFLQEKQELIAEMVSTVYRHCRLPLSVKIRVLDDLDATIKYALLCEAAGASMIAIHGRTREQRGVNTGVADWQKIRAVCERLSVPTIANGNIQMPGDVEKCLEFTKATAVMSAEGLLSNPALFDGKILPSYELAAEYVNFAEKYEAGTSSIRAHVFRICHYSLLEFADLRDRVSYAFSYDEFRAIVEELRQRCETNETDGLAYLTGKETTLSEQVAKIPHWFSKPYIRPVKIETGESDYRRKRHEEMEKIQQETGLSLKQIRKRERRRLDLKKMHSARPDYPPCRKCSQPAGMSCQQRMCRRCCKWLCTRRNYSCSSHQNCGAALQKRRVAFAAAQSLTMEELMAGKFEIPFEL
ncbi:TRNA-dihydrouridine(16/17) synthase [Aphelenchoides besseyi]|nr:TRNA-dihydrouridine(16/17) synthase [Aphelenchoides besseyi]KAI6210418.1 TRNA-dihydrouridine(16/17) synthase [Aphelenchoides besseyi]